MRKPSVLLLVALAATVSAQAPAVRRATNVASLTAYAAFYQLRPVLIVGTISQQDNGDLRVSDGTGALRIIAKGNAPDGLGEVRGDFWDLGRMSPEDPRLAGFDLQSTFHVDPEGAWPRPGQIMALVASTVTPTSAPTSPSIRNMVLFPSRFSGEKVTVTGQFAGRNLLGELPDAPAKSRYDFVLRSADAAIWVTNLRPRGKDFELALDTRIDTGRWLEVSGTLQQGRGLQWLDAAAGSLKLTKAPDTNALEAPVRIAIAPAPEVLFSAPTGDESDVLLSTSIRVQFSRDIDAATIKGHVRVKYDDKETIERGEPVTPTANFTTQYSGGSRVLEIHFAEPLERFRRVIVELDEGILGTDKQPLKPWTITFNTGGT
jgi:Big-like domain-containing protein